MKKGIIFEITDKYLTLLTPDGQFLQTQNQGQSYQIGQEIDFIPLEAKVEKTLTFFLANKLSSVGVKRLAVAAVGFLLFTASLFPIYQDNKVYAYMSIESESSVELAFNKDLEVIELIPYNKQGETLIETIGEWEKQDLSAVSSRVLKEMERQGIENNQIVVSTVFEGNRNNNSDNQLKEEMDQIKEETRQNDIHLTVVKGTKEERENAKKQGKTIGEYKQKQNQDIKNKADEKQQKTEAKKAKQKNNGAQNQPVNESKQNNQLNPKIDLNLQKSGDPYKNNNSSGKQPNLENQKGNEQNRGSNPQPKLKQPNENSLKSNGQQKKLGFVIEKSELICPDFFPLII